MLTTFVLAIFITIITAKIEKNIINNKFYAPPLKTIMK